MAKFFTSPRDIAQWVKENGKESVKLITAILQEDNNHRDVAESVDGILSGKNIETASKTLFSIFSQHDIAEQEVKTAIKKVQVMKTANQDNTSKGLTKEAQIMRQPGEYPMRLRVCPKLPASVGKRLISTYNCRHYCIDSLVFDDDPDGVYCSEALWRKHVMDKFSREWMDPKTGKYIGGYINSRFHVFPDAGTPDNPDVDRTQGNSMALEPHERLRQPRSHEYSMERRLEEARKKGSTKALTVTAADDLRNALYAQAESKGFVKIASADVKNPPSGAITEAFNDAIELSLRGVPEDEALAIITKNHGLKVEKAYQIQSMALRKMATHGADVYMIKTATGIPVANAPGINIGDYYQQPDGSILHCVGPAKDGSDNIQFLTTPPAGMADTSGFKAMPVNLPLASTASLAHMDIADSAHPLHGIDQSQEMQAAKGIQSNSLEVAQEANPTGNEASDGAGASGVTGPAAGKNF